MLTLRSTDQRFHTQIDWLDSRHSFSFGEHYDPAHMGFRELRVINEDWIAPGGGFGTHGHRDMEILTYIISGGLMHRDSMGNGSQIRAGEVQRMSAGTGVRHSEHNASADEPVHLLQIWIQPERQGLEPGYEQRAFPTRTDGGGLQLLASRDGRDGSLTVHQDMSLYAGTLAAGERVVQDLEQARHAWVQVVRGSVRINGEPLGAGDGAALSDTRHIEMHADEQAELLVFDLA